MKGVTILCFVATLALSSPSSENLYTDRYDSINLDEILSNRRLLIPYVNCLLEKGKCTPEGNELKSHIREAMENDCAKCTAAQRRGTNQVIGHLINQEPDYWRQLSEKYDPTHKFALKYEKELRSVSA